MNVLLVNLAVADVVIGVFMLPRHVFHHAFDHPTGQWIHFYSNFWNVRRKECQIEITLRSIAIIQEDYLLFAKI